MQALVFSTPATKETIGSTLDPFGKRMSEANSNRLMYSRARNTQACVTIVLSLLHCRGGTHTHTVSAAQPRLPAPWLPVHSSNLYSTPHPFSIFSNQGHRRSRMRSRKAICYRDRRNARQRDISLNFTQPFKVHNKLYSLLYILLNF